MNKGDIYLARFPYGGTVGSKVRPALLLTGLIGPVPEVVTAYLSAVIPANLLPTDLVLDPVLPLYASTNLSTASVVRLHKLATLHQRDTQLGTLSLAAIAEVDLRLRTLLAL